MRRRILTLLAAPALAVLITAPALAIGAPTELYTHDSANSFTISGGHNSGNYNVRAEWRCNTAGSFTYAYGPWVAAGGSSTASGSCSGIGGVVDMGYTQERQNDPVRFDCWTIGEPTDGVC